VETRVCRDARCSMGPVCGAAPADTTPSMSSWISGKSVVIKGELSVSEDSPSMVDGKGASACPITP